MATASRSAKRSRSTSKSEWSERWKAQREHLLQAAQRAIHRDGPHISMDEIASEAGITKPILYRHFGDRRGLARALRDTLFGNALGGSQTDTESALKAARDRVAALYPVVENPEELRRVVVGFATGYQMFVELNRNVYRFLRAEGVMDRMWEESESSFPEPVSESLTRSLQAVYRNRGIDAVSAQIWAHALRGMVTGVVDWWTEAHACDRFELERHFDLLARAIITGVGPAVASRPKPASARARARGRAASAAPRRGKAASPKRERRT